MKNLSEKELENFGRRYQTLSDLFSAQERINHVDFADFLLKIDNIITLQQSKEMYFFDANSGLYLPYENRLASIVKFAAHKNHKIAFICEVKAAIQAETFINNDKLEPPPHLIPLANCVYDFVEKKTLPFSSELFFFKKHPIEFLPSSEPLLENPIDVFLSEVCEKQEDVVFLKEFVGYCFYRAMPFHTITLLVGAGANGKSVFLEILRRLVGRENICERTLQELTDNRFSTYELYQKNVNIVGDLPAKALQDTGLLKRASGNDVLTGEKKYGHSFTFRPYAKIICAANELPETPDHSQGFFRRMEIVNFPNSFEGKENRNLVDELCTSSNLSQFCLSCLEAFNDALGENNWIRSYSTTQKQEKYYAYSNSSTAFCTAMLEYEPESEIASQEIYIAYKKFCLEKKLISKDERSFFVSLYRFFSNRVFKKRRVSEIYADVPPDSSSIVATKEVRQYFICGVSWKDEKEVLNVKSGVTDEQFVVSKNFYGVDNKNAV